MNENSESSHFHGCMELEESTASVDDAPCYSLEKLKSVCQRLELPINVSEQVLLDTVYDFVLQQTLPIPKNAFSQLSLGFTNYGLNFFILHAKADEMLDNAGAYLRLMYISDLKTMQKSANDFLARLQEKTANPRVLT